ncbi:TniB family NTP-binding protein [Vibrio mangrovi]|uniref:Bacterial TniB protein n=1 Tax=Vibrio mangrovi TaxID=474394 RepID=A0A1Y6IYR1_9VIBR|nr:TniB family NTP-binding protein [Vibrio mangrovi]MDW6002334.1 TniB family NTP-binding protein [Vibrio mangrovi]SMS02768.1 Bacterial TniB protein [Vibrio mangrovi]
MSETSIDEYAHLGAVAKEYVQCSIEQRIDYIRSPHWIGYPKAKDIIAKLDDLLTYPKRHRMPNLLIIGESNSGKTMIAERFVKMHPAYEREDNDGIVIPVLSIQAPPVPSESRLYSNILDKMFAPYRPSDSTEKKQFQVIRLVQACNVQMLIIDEIHSILAGNLEKQRVFLSVLRNLGNELKIPIVGLGIKDALRAMKTDPQLDNRFKPVLLPQWEYSTDYRRLLASFESVLPLKKASKLSKKTIALKLLSMSEGLLGELSELLSEAAIKAIETEKECIDLDILNSLEWLSPTLRRSV